MTQRHKYECCFEWDLMDCQDKSIYALCDRWQYDNDYKPYWKRQREYIDSQEEHQCREYRYNGAKCRFPVWGIVLLVLAAVLVVVVMIAVCYYVRLRSRRQKQRNQMIEE
ncbi:uncharacterized protein LOC128952455 [Oppia nitens]|uniref:uncharacterized protein LOC128952455 n=1 Tax=Oppia nitens TaxID=1686743 RepID=UPI0023D9BF05|nr:uncharacterized protein LOC128952455 [Oppia nitens]